jgi:hypothetical protein
MAAWGIVFACALARHAGPMIAGLATVLAVSGNQREDAADGAGAIAG